MSVIVTIYREGDFTKVELKKGDRRAEAVGEAKGFPLWLILKAAIRIRLSDWIGLVMSDAVFLVAAWACIEMAGEDVHPAVSAVFVLFALVLAGAAVYFVKLFREVHYGPRE